jgi:nucleoid DNA-binding protein
MGNKILGKSELVDLIAATSGLTKKDAQQALSATLGAIEAGLKEGSDINITGFGKFKVAHRPERMGRNPATGADLKIAASNTVTFSVGSGLKSAVN